MSTLIDDYIFVDNCRLQVTYKSLKNKNANSTRKYSNDSVYSKLIGYQVGGNSALKKFQFIIHTSDLPLASADNLLVLDARHHIFSRLRFDK